jgi:hypothetical protein
LYNWFFSWFYPSAFDLLGIELCHFSCMVLLVQWPGLWIWKVSMGKYPFFCFFHFLISSFDFIFYLKKIKISSFDISFFLLLFFLSLFFLLFYVFFLLLIYFSLNFVHNHLVLFDFYIKFDPHSFDFSPITNWIYFSISSLPFNLKFIFISILVSILFIGVYFV